MDSVPKSQLFLKKTGEEKARSVALNYKEICHNLEMNLLGYRGECQMNFEIKHMKFKSSFSCDCRNCRICGVSWIMLATVCGQRRKGKACVLLPDEPQAPGTVPGT